MSHSSEPYTVPPSPAAVVIDLSRGPVSGGDILPPVDPESRNARLACVGLMSAGMAHDLGNLLQIIEAGLRGMERRMDEGHGPELRALSLEVRGAATRASSLTRRILDYSRGSANAEAPVDVGGAILKMRALIGWAAGPSVQLVLAIQPRLPVIRCAPAELESAVINLVFNARHAMPEGGTLTLSVCSHEDSVMLRVADTGCGMPRDVVRRMGEPFVTTRPDAGGSGLGLAIVSAFMRGLGGAIAVDSIPGRGTAITLTFRGHET